MLEKIAYYLLKPERDRCDLDDDFTEVVVVVVG